MEMYEKGCYALKEEERSKLYDIEKGRNQMSSSKKHRGEIEKRRVSIIHLQ
jgi:hypothetical protein